MIDIHDVRLDGVQELLILPTGGLLLRLGGQPTGEGSFLWLQVLHFLTSPRHQSIYTNI